MDKLPRLILTVVCVVAAAGAAATVALTQQYETRIARATAEELAQQTPSYDVLAVQTGTPNVTCFMLLSAVRTVKQMSCVELSGENHVSDNPRPETPTGVRAAPAIDWSRSQIQNTQW